MDNARTAAVLEMVQGLFADEESHGHPAIINDGPQFIGEKLGYSPAEVLVILRMLHRKGFIALLNSFGPHVSIARDQSLLKLPIAVITDGGRNAKLSKGPRSRPSEAPAQDEQPPEVAGLLAYIAELERELDGVQAKYEHTEQRRRNIKDARDREKEARTSAEAELGRVKAENRTLKQEADKVPELERRLAEQQGHRTIPSDLAASIARLTQ